MTSRNETERHISKARMVEVGWQSAAEDDNDENCRFASEEFAHLTNCPDCADAFGNLVREILRNT